MAQYYLAFVEGYEDPMRLVGPFGSHDEAVEAWWKSIIEAGYEPEEGETAHSAYVGDDAVRVAVLSQEVKHG